MGLNTQCQQWHPYMRYHAKAAPDEKQAPSRSSLLIQRLTTAAAAAAAHTSSSRAKPYPCHSSVIHSPTIL
jgi:hypothetical protein